MGKHEQINRLLVDYVLGELSQEQLSEIKTHLTECQRCSGEVKRLEALLECTGQMSELSVDEQMCESAKKALFATINQGPGARKLATDNCPGWDL